MDYTVRDNVIEIHLPITYPTGMARVKRRNSLSELGIPVATRQTPIVKECYVEWQIAYDTLEATKSTSGVSFNRLKIVDGSSQTKYLYELSDYLWDSLHVGMITPETVNDLIQFGSTVLETEFIETNMVPFRQGTDLKLTDKCNFLIYYEKLPVLLLQSGDAYIEMLVKPKQRAIGSQAMLFLDIPITAIQEWNELEGREANRLEKVTFPINEYNINLLMDIAKCFMLASKQHNLDVIAILNAIMKEYC